MQKVLTRAWVLYQRMGPDEVFFQVTGNPNPQMMEKGSPDEKFDITVSFDTTENDPEGVKQQIESMATLMQYDKNGRINPDRLIEIAAASVNPFLADYILEPSEESQQRVLKENMNSWYGVLGSSSNTLSSLTLPRNCRPMRHLQSDCRTTTGSINSLHNKLRMPLLVA